MKKKILTTLFLVMLAILPTTSSAAETIRLDSLVSGDSITFSDFPYFIKKGLRMELRAHVEEFGKIYIGKGHIQYRGDWLEISRKAITHQHFESSVTDKYTEAHGLDIANDIAVSMTAGEGGVLHVTLKSGDGVFETLISTWDYEANYAPFVISDGSMLSDLVITADNTDFQRSVWVFGDSYVGVYRLRWPGLLRDWGFFDFMLNGLPGLDSPMAVRDLKRALRHGSPKYLLWCLGMNDKTESYKSCLEEVIAICDTLQITLVCTTIPTTPTVDREEITTYVRERGVRYVDFYKAVGTNPEGQWHEGYLFSDNVHPTIEGATALAKQVLRDFPEIMGGNTPHSHSRCDTNGDGIVDVADIATIISEMAGK